MYILLFNSFVVLFMFNFSLFSAYVWSDALIPEFSAMNQTLEGLFRIGITSLSFALVQVLHNH